MTKIYFIAGEVSGDFIGGRIINQLKNDKELTFTGVGGEYIEEAGNFKSLFPISEIILMGFLEIIPKIFRLRKLINNTVQDVIKNKPNLLITIDSPGFTYRVAKQLKKLLPDLKMMHIVAPSVWAYKENRAVKYAKIYNYLLALLPFEPPYFTKVGLDCRYIGHPVMEQEFYSDKLALRDEFNINNDTKILCVTLGSRKGEILRHLPIFLSTIEELCNSYEANSSDFEYKESGEEFIISEMVGEGMGKSKSIDYKNLMIIFTLANSSHAELIKPLLVNVKFDYLFSCERLKSYAVADLALAKSGTNTLEIAASGTPMAVAYKVNIFSYFIIKALIKIKYVTLINIIAGKEIIPEFIQFNCRASLIVPKLKELLLDSEKAYKQVIESKKVLNQLGFKSRESLSYNAAKIIKEVLK
ncbi:MAG TPA: lipid-A-disaccharide synthase [Rickettsia endosymbiont of Pyrocoelia pectoralis]|nr:lipid-A-disaccharide synthase [Rickettsia endosymbiont of Pyrocoelia pectoralis]